MTRQMIIERTVRVLNQLPEEKAKEISAFAEFVMKQYEESRLTEGLHQLTGDSHSFEFLKHEEEIYTEKDLKKVYDAKK